MGLFPGSESATHTVRVKLHESATLPCSERCSESVRWTVSHEPTEILAECNQTSCRSVKEGYQMIHDQYLKGDLSLTITDADLSKRTWYTCQCGSKDVCDVRLQTETLNTTLQVQPHEPLFLKLDVSDPVEVIYNSTGGAGPSSGQICTVDGGSLQCRPDYTQRVSVFSALELRGATPSDGGVYTIVDVRNRDVIRSYTVSVQGDQSENRAAVPVWMMVLGVMWTGLTAVVVVMMVQLRRENHRLRMDGRKNGADTNHHGYRTRNSEMMRIFGKAIVPLSPHRSQSAAPTVRVKLHGSATLPCSENCSGVVRWTVSHKPTEVLAECNQTSCRSVKEGYQMIHDQYLKGDLSLTITDADLSKRGRYTCDCDNIDLSDVDLQIEPLNTSVQITAGESLVMKLDIPDPVEVFYNSRGASGAPRVQICTVNKLLLQCELEYRHRVSLRSYLELRQMSPSDSGLYTVMDLQNNVLHTYTVTVKDDQQSLDRDPTPDPPLWMTILSKFSLCVSLLFLGLALVVVAVQARRNSASLRLEHPHTAPADGAVGVQVEGHHVFCDDRPSILVLTTVPPHTDSLGISTKTKAGLVTEDDPLPF
ncbi:hypothetical protein NFI96_007011 [Prochilodus magdalenae]|nr:hypothetical protein NFI96_007011 [Prochilodus magdalenae]